MSVTSAAAPSVRIIKTKRGGNQANPTTEYSALLNTVRSRGLLQRRVGFYAIVLSILIAATGGAVTGFVLLHDTWYMLLIAGAFGVLFTQFAFLAHEASHRQVFTSGKANDLAGRILANAVVGISYSWWMHKHSRHHANPNVIGKDPDIEPDFIVFREEDAKQVPRWSAFITKRQGYLFFPLLLLEGFNLHFQGMKTVFGRKKVDKRSLEITMIMVRTLAYLGVVFYFMPLGMAFAFVGVQMGIFGLYMGASFAPNHKGMPQLEKDSKVDFLRRQVLTSRNIRSTLGVDSFMGGLNFQVEHHLFPNMPRPNLRRAQEITKEYCKSHDILYTETTLVGSYRIVVEYLNKVGLAARDPFECPMIAARH